MSSLLFGRCYSFAITILRIYHAPVDALEIWEKLCPSPMNVARRCAIMTISIVT